MVVVVDVGLQCSGSGSRVCGGDSDSSITMIVCGNE